MENIKQFYIDLQNHIDNKIKEEDTLEKNEAGYKIIPRIDAYIFRDHINAIANKIFTINENDRLIYADFIISAIDVYYNYNLSKTKSIDNDSVYIETIYVDKDTKLLFDSSSVEYDCYMFVQFVAEVFLKFKINLHEIAKTKDLTSDICIYEVLFPEIENFNHSNINNKNKDFTTSRQVMAIEYLLSALNIDCSNTEKTRISRFIQLLTGKQSDLLPQNTTIYKLIGNKANSIKTYNKDCDFVADEFNKIGLSQIANLILNGKE